LSEIVVAFFERNLLKFRQKIFENHFGLENVLGEPDHAASRDGGRCGVLEVVDLEHDSDVRGKGETLAVGKSLKGMTTLS
jgi:hypothetical protein